MWLWRKFYTNKGYVMAYSDKVVDHYENPRNVGSLNPTNNNVGTGLVGAPECGDVMKLQIQVENDRIVDAKFKTFGCGSAIAASSLATEWVKDKPIDEAKKVAEEVLKPLTKMQLDIWGCKYHELIMGKPHADLFIDDKGINCDDFFKD